MLKRMQTLQNIAERTSLRLYFTGNHVKRNLQSQYFASRNLSFSIKKPLVLRRCLASTEKRCVTIIRGTHSSADNTVSMEEVTENSYARTILASSKKAPKTIGLPLDTIEIVSDKDVEGILNHDWKALSPDEIFKAFKSLSCHAKLKSLSLSQDEHGAILFALSEKLQNLSNKQLSQIFRYLLLWKNIQWEKCPGYTDLWMQIDKACIKRLPALSTEEALLFTDYWYQLRLARKAKYPWLTMRELGNKPKKLNVINFFHLMFLINVCRKPPINMYEIEYHFDSILDEFTANELGVIVMAFFKTQTPFRDQKIVSRIHMKLLEEWSTVEDISLSAVMKMTRYSMGLNDLRTFCKILDHVKSRVFKLSIPCLVHIAHAAAYVQCYDAELMHLIIQRFEKDIDRARLKDMERFCWVLTIFNYNSETPLYHKIVESLRNPKRTEEIARFPTIIPTALMHLSHAGVFPVDLIKNSLNPAFLHRVYNNNVYKIGWDFFALENNVKIEVPEYDGPFLDDNIREFLSKKYNMVLMRSKDKYHITERFTLEVAHMCKLILGSDKAIHIDQVLPHFMKPDIIICLDEANNPVAPEPILSEMPIGSIKYTPQEASNLRWIAVVLATPNQMLRGTTIYIGLMTSKIRQLKKLGYSPVVVPFTIWRDLKDLEAKQNYLKNLLPITARDEKVSAEAL